VFLGVFASFIANLSFDQSKIPSQFKQAQVTSLLKKAGRDVNYMPSYIEFEHVIENH